MPRREARQDPDSYTEAARAVDAVMLRSRDGDGALAVATLLGLAAPYRNVVCLGLILDEEGQKMSKSRGNTVEPWSVLRRPGSPVGCRYPSSDSNAVTMPM